MHVHCLHWLMQLVCFPECFCQIANALVWPLNHFNNIVMRYVLAASSLQLPQVWVYSMLCFLHEHLSVLQSVWQLHLITRSRCLGAGGSNGWIGTNSSSHSCHPQSLGWSSAADPFQSWTWRYTQRLWYFAAAEVGGNDCNSMCHVFEATLSQKCLCQRESSVSVNIPL